MMDRAETSVIGELLKVDRLRPFLVDAAEHSKGPQTITLHTVQPVAMFRDPRRIRKSLAAAGIDARVKVRRHRTSALAKARSLEGFLRPFGGSVTLSDPTGAIDRARDLTSFSKRLRLELGRKVAGLYWDPRWKLIYLVLDHRAYFKDGKAEAASLAAVEDAAYAHLAKALGEEAGRFVFGLRLGFEIPDVNLVPIDEASAFSPRAPKGAGLQARAIAAALSAMIGLGATSGLAVAEESNVDGKSDAAVSAPNFDLGALGGVRDGEEIFLFEGSATLPLGEAFGIRIDGSAGGSNGAFVGGAAGHLFWRNPYTGLLGVQGGFTSVRPDNATRSEGMGRIGGMGELYIEDLTVLAAVGGQFGNSRIKDGVYGKVGLEWFATPNLMFHVNGEYDPERDGLARFGVEWLPGLEGLPGLSLYAEAAFGDDDYERVLAGFRIHFGQHNNRTLKQRYRYDTFRNTLMPTESSDAAKAKPQRAAPGYSGYT